MNRYSMLLVIVGMTLIISALAAARPGGTPGGGGETPICPKSIATVENSGANDPNCTEFYSCCSNQYCEDWGPLGGGDKLTCGTAVNVQCSGTITQGTGDPENCQGSSIVIQTITCTVQIYQGGIDCY